MLDGVAGPTPTTIEGQWLNLEGKVVADWPLVKKYCPMRTPSYLPPVHVSDKFYIASVML